MPRVCYIRPNRKRPRYFKPCDVARIAQNCLDDSDGSVTAEQLLAVVAKQLGFTHISLSVDPRSVDDKSTSLLIDKLEAMRDSLNRFLKKFGIDG